MKSVAALLVHAYFKTAAFVLVGLLSASASLGQGQSERAWFPVEVYGGGGTAVKAISVSLERAPAQGSRLVLKAHRLAYRDASVNPDRGAKGSIRVNGGKWVPLSNRTPGIQFKGQYKDLGGLNGAYHTVNFSIPATGLREGRNDVEFRFNGSDGFSNGYRILDLHVKSPSRDELVDRSLYGWANPKKWKAPLGGQADRDRGRELWFKRELRESAVNDAKIRATCSDCHARDGRDLKYFNYSNESIQKRSEFHGLTPKEGKQIASYIRGLDVPAPKQARPWNPPYQPGPGLDEKPVEEWSAGAGLGAVLAEDEQMYEYLFPKGMRDYKERMKVIDFRGRLNLRELPIALQLPDWNEWLPETHPKDAFTAGTFSNGSADETYRELRRYLKDTPRKAYLNGQLTGKLGGLTSETVNWLNEGSTNTRGKWRVKDGDALARLSRGTTRQEAVSYIAKWVATKSWEVMHEFDLEDVAPELYPEGDAEVRAWPSRDRSVFQAAPHIVADNLNNLAHQTSLVGDAQSTMWYNLQMILNAGQRQPAGEKPMDWPYQQKHLNDLTEHTGVAHPFRFLATQIKVNQERLNGSGSGRNGYELRSTHPWWNHSDPFGKVHQFAALEKLGSNFPNLVKSALLTEFLDVVEFDEHESFDADAWSRVDHDSPSTKRWGAVEPLSYVPGDWSHENGKLFAYPENYHAENFYLLIPLLNADGINPKTVNRLVDWCKGMWPEGDWDALRPEEPGRVYRVRARGVTGTEKLQLVVGGERVATFALTKEMEEYVYRGPERGVVRVAFAEDLGVDHDVQVDRVEIDGEWHEAEDQAINTATCSERAYSEWMYCRGYIEFAPYRERVYRVVARGVRGTESLGLTIGGERVADFALTTEMTEYVYRGPERGVVRVNMDKDLGDLYDIQVDKVEIDGTWYEAENQAVNTAVCGSFAYTEWLYCVGYIEFTPGQYAYRVRARGVSGAERVGLTVGGAAVADFDLDDAMRDYIYTGPERGVVRVTFADEGGVGYDAHVDGVEILGEWYEAEDQAVNTATFDFAEGYCSADGYSDRLTCAGYVEFVPGYLGSRRPDDVALDQAFGAYPNPAVDRVTLTLRGADEGAYDGERVRVAISDGMGRVVWERDVAVRPGPNRYDVDVTEFARGTYTAYVATRRSVRPVRIVLQE